MLREMEDVAKLLHSAAEAADQPVSQGFFENVLT